MGVFVNYRIKKSINTLLSLQNGASSEVTQALTRLRQIGQPAIPKLIEALSQARYRERIIAVLVTLLNNDTFPLFVTALSRASSRVGAGILEVFAQGKNYDPNRLLGLLSHQRINRAELEKVLIRHRHTLQPDVLLRLLSSAGKESQLILLRLLEHVATEAVIPELVYSIRSDDWQVRFHIARTLSRFHTSTARNALVRLLSDTNKNVRLVALEGLATAKGSFDVGPICRLVADPDETVRAKATDLLVSLLQHQSEQFRRRAVESLSTTSNKETLRGLVSALKDKEWWVTIRVADAIGTCGGTRIVDAALMLLKDSDAFVRECAFEILQAMKDERALNSLVKALKNKPIRESAVEALAALGDKRAVPLFINMLEGDTDTEATMIAIRALVALGEPQAIHPLLAQLQKPDKTIQQEALRALAVLTNEEYAPDVLQAIMAVRETSEPEVKELANRMATSIIKRFGQKVMPPSALTESTEMSLQDLADETVMATSAQERPSAEPSQEESGVPVGEQGTGAFVDISALEPGMILADRYRIIRRVGQGNFSTVFLVNDTMVHEDVILKILNPQVALDSTMIKRFVHELRYARKVTHENVIRIHDFLTIGKLYAISMEYFPSHNLAEELSREAPIDLRRGLKIVWAVCRGVGAAHQVDVVHRDLKPPNILIDDAGLVKIVDFGVAAVTSDMATRLTRVGTLLGTPTYMAPEQVRSRSIDARTDIYSLGVIMYEMFTGRPPYIGEDMSVLFQHVEGNPTSPRRINPELAPELEAIILKAMAVDPDQRFQTVDELRKSLVDFARKKR
jgi:HEAT repeat protein/tRNA A-37 threonylcarbamoyl transferase component Bud32